MKINKKHYLVLGLVSMCFLACNSDNGQKSLVDYSSGSAAATMEANNASSSNANGQTNSLVSHPSTKLGNLMNSNTGTLSAAGSGLNPAHGLPGHDCAVDVGAPLPAVAAVPVSAPVANTSPTLNQQNLSVKQPVKSNVKINPAHGQPGHDCAVAVGAPLTGSGGASGSVSVQQSASSPSALSGITAPPAGIAAPTGNATQAASPNFNLPTKGGKVNPAHGQPGHDCGVAVGAPLPG
jgi:hypothetical protein